ncbi:hypothetical protein ACFW2D_28805 [Streptomyces sp. NPDC058914]|uniref:hypothetical protein n=1 Tax=Streptomyces TaxID=1883 RepID=UPI0036803D15
MGRDGLVPGSAWLHLIDGLPLLRPDEQVFEAMIKGEFMPMPGKIIARVRKEW